jgi:hypothetical protein
VYASRLLVPHRNFPVWRRQAIGGLLQYTDLYTSVRDGKESDAVERWLNDEFENPAMEALLRVRADETLTAEHWNRLERWALALDVRTPGHYFETVKRLEKQLPDMLKKTLKSATRRSREDWKKRSAEVAALTNAESLPFKVWTERLPEGGGRLHAKIVAGREMWLHGIRYNLTETIKKLPKLTWSILRPFRDSEWFTSDHPLVRLGYKSEKVYDFGGGWGRDRCEIFVPLSPRHLMYAMAGRHQPADSELTREMTRKFQRFIAERADRWIINRTEATRPLMFRSRVVSKDAFDAEELMWDEWHLRQTQAERGSG